MYIQCTKKLLAKLEQPYGVLPNPPEAFYCWHASIFEQRDIMYVVMMNDLTGEEVFFEVETFKDFNKKVLSEIRLGMRDTGASAKEASAYMKKAGPLTFGPTSDRSMVGELSGFTKRMKKFVDMMEGFKEILDDPQKREELFAAVDEMFEMTKPALQKSNAFVGKDEITPMVALDVKLILTGDKQVKRSFLVPLHISFATLHIILQIGFGWYDNHLHEFSLKKDSVTIGMKLGDMGIEEDDDDMLDEEETMLSDFIPSERSFRYLYDLGDLWEHVIRVGKVTTVKGGPFVECTGGKGSTPPEDCGGAVGYENLCEILGDPTHEEYDEMLDWAGDDFDAGFDKAFINEELQELQFVPHPSRS